MNFQVVVDVGNSRIKWGRCADGRVQVMCSLPPDDPSAWEKQLLDWQKKNPFETQSWLISGVHPARIEVFAQWATTKASANAASAACRVISSRQQIPIDARVDYPDKVGLDRLFNGVAANARRGPEQPALIVDAGSAVTVDYVDEHGAFRGGAIFPGVRLMAQALHAYTAKLPVVEVAERLEPPATSTERAMQVGVFHAVLGGIELLVREMQARFQQEAAIFFGGGDAALLAGHLPWPVTVWPEMTLEGIRLAAG